MSRTAVACAAGLWLAVVGSANLPAQAGYTWSLPAGVRAAAGAGRQPDVGIAGRARPAPLLRRAALGQRDAVVRHLPRAGTRLHRRQGSQHRLHRPTAHARQHEPGQRGLRGDADVGQSHAGAARGPGAGADVRHDAGRTGAGPLRRSLARRDRRRRHVSTPPAGGVPRRLAAHPRSRGQGPGRFRAGPGVDALALRPLSFRSRRHRDLRVSQARRDAVPQPAAVVLHLPRRRAVLERDERRAWPGDVPQQRPLQPARPALVPAPATPACTARRGGPKTSASSRPRRCATSP